MSSPSNSRHPVASASAAGADHARTPHVARVAHGIPCVWCLSPSNDRSALLVDIYEAPRALTLIASTPGVRRSDIDVATGGRMVTIRVAQPVASRPKRSSTVRRERYAGHWSRAIELPFPVDVSAVSWTLVRGVLTVRIAKPAPSSAAAQHSVE